jgi:hypothetical protein
LLYVVHAYRDKKVVSVFVRFRAQQHLGDTLVNLCVV